MVAQTKSSNAGLTGKHLLRGVWIQSIGGSSLRLGALLTESINLVRLSDDRCFGCDISFRHDCGVVKLFLDEL
jgi:hypothetical protein